MNDKKLKEEESEKLLGSYFQSNLKWTRQITELTKKLKTRLAALVKIRNCAPMIIKKINDLSWYF